MSLCVLPVNKDSCEALGWPGLDGQCIDCYRQSTLKAAWEALVGAEISWQRIRDALYNVEVASGRRPGQPVGSLHGPSLFAADGRYRRPSRAARGRTAQSQLVRDDPDDSGE